MLIGEQQRHGQLRSELAHQDEPDVALWHALIVAPPPVAILGRSTRTGWTGRSRVADHGRVSNAMAGGYDVIVVGLGAMGSSAAYQLAQRGARVLGIERFTPAHGLGSSGGVTRIIRMAYFEHPDYVPLLRRAWALWPEIEQASGRRLLLKTGGAYIGRAGSDVLEGARRSAEQHDLPHEVLDADEAGRRFPALKLDADMALLHEANAGLLFAGNCIEAHLDLARRHGAELHFEERVVAWQSAGAAGGVQVTTDHGSYAADRLVLAVGAWLPHLAPDLNLPLQVERNVPFWFEPSGDPAAFGPDRLPVWIMELDDTHAFYGFPALPGGPDTPAQAVKVARHHGGQTTDPDTLERAPTAADEAVVRGFLEAHMPLANGRVVDASVCMYTNTPDQHFILDRHPRLPNVVIASPCSGHGFKFSGVVGELVADLALGQQPSLEIGFLGLDRFRG